MYEYFIGQLLGQLHNMKQNCSSLALLNKESFNKCYTSWSQYCLDCYKLKQILSGKDGVESPSYGNDMKYYTIKSLKTYYSMGIGCIIWGWYSQAVDVHISFTLILPSLTFSIHWLKDLYSVPLIWNNTCNGWCLLTYTKPNRRNILSSHPGQLDFLQDK